MVSKENVRGFEKFHKYYWVMAEMEKFDWERYDKKQFQRVMAEKVSTRFRLPHRTFIADTFVLILPFRVPIRKINAFH